MAEEKSGQHPQTHGGQTREGEPSMPDKLPPGGKPGPVSDDDLMKIRRAAGAIAEVIEPVTRVRQERTDR